MPSLPTEWSALLALVFVLGLRHGIDADHIATIDALTRLSADRARRPARWCGLLFALGHGLAVLLMVGSLSLLSRQWQAPAWLAPLGAWISITLLAALGLANLRAAWGAAPGEMVALRGLRGRLLGRWLGQGHPVAAAAIGALFAASFDTVGLALMFTLSGGAAGGPGHALLLGAVFAAGMLVTDGANGWWLARLLTQTGRAAARASRLTALAVGWLSLAVALLGALRWTSADADAWLDGIGPWISAALLLVTLAAGALLAWRPALRRGFRPASESATAS